MLHFTLDTYLIMLNGLIGQVGRVFANGPEDLGSIPDRIIPKTLKMVLDISLLNTQQYKVRIANFTFTYIYIYILNINIKIIFFTPTFFREEPQI